MLKFDHFSMTVGDLKRSRDWYLNVLGLTLEFEVPGGKAVAVQDTDGFTIFLNQDGSAPTTGFALTFQVDDVEETHAHLVARGADVVHGPARDYWGWGVEVRDPDGHTLLLWDKVSMAEKGG